MDSFESAIQTKKNQPGFQQDEENGLPANCKGYAARTAFPTASGWGNTEIGNQSLQGFSANGFGSDEVVQGKFDLDGAWMQKVSKQTLSNKFGQTTASLWSAMADSGQYLGVTAEGSGASYNFVTKMVTISKSWLDKVQDYVEKDIVSPELGNAISSLTHELSHAHDQIIRKDSPGNANRDTDDYVIAVLRTELKAWMKEARSARENKKVKNIEAGLDSQNLIKGWLGVHYSIKENKDVLNCDIYNNPVIGRLKKYFNDNRSKSSPTTLDLLLKDGSNNLFNDLKNYADQIRNKYSSGDNIIRPMAVEAIADK